MSDVIDDLKVQIDASTQSADAKLDKFIAKMMKLQSTITGLEMSNVSNIASGINQISASIQNFNNRTKTADFSRVATGMNKLATVDAQGVAATAQAMSTFAANMMGLNDVHVDSDGISNIANAISKLGRATVTEATQNLEFLKTSMKDFITGMNGAGSLTFDANGLVSLVNSVSRLGSTNATQSVKNLPQISTALRGFITSMNTVGSVAFDFAGLNNLVSNITRLGGVKATQAATNLKPIKDQILRFMSGLNGIGSLSFDTTSLANLVSSITKLGGKAATTAIPNIQALGTALTKLMATLSHAPAVSQNLIQMTTALASLAGNGSRVSSASTAMYRGLNLYSSSASRATKATKGLVSQIGMFYAKCFLLIRGAKALWKATESSMDYIETLNYFEAAWGQVAGNATGEWKKAGYESAEAYAKSFSERAKALTGKMTGFQPDAYGNLIATGMPSLGLDPEKLMNYQATFGQMASSMGVASETALKLSNALTMIGADLASVKNLKFEDVWQDMASGMVGMSRTLDKYGVNIRNVNLQEKLYELGIDAKIAKLGQQDKALLRTIILLQSTKYAWGDMADTIGQPANQLRLLQANFANLARTIGNLLLPIVSKVLPYINALVIAIQRLFSWIGGLLGIKIGGFSSSIGSAATDFGDMEDAADGIADSTGDAAKNTKKMADNLQEFDNLNVVNSQKDSGSGGSGSGGGAGGLLDDAFNDAFAEYQAAWDAAFANMENSAQEMADKICNAFKSGDYFGIGQYIGDGITGALKSINWESVYSVAQGFGNGLAEFLNGLISPELFGSVGGTIAGCLNTALHFMDSFGVTFDWKDFGLSISTGINEFFGTFDFSLLAKSINVWVQGIWTTIKTAISGLDWKTIFSGVKDFLGNIELETVGIIIGSITVKKFGKLLFSGALAKQAATAISKSILSSLAKGLSFAGIGKVLSKAFPSSLIVSTITTTMAETGASLPAVLSSLILTPIKTFFTVTIPGTITGALSSIGTMITGGITALAGTLGVSVAAAGAIVIAAAAAAVAGVIYTVTHWDEIKEFWTVTVPEWWSGIVVPFFEGIPDKLSKVWELVKTTASKKWDALLDYLGGIPEKIGGVVSDIGEWFNQLPGKIGYALGYALGTVTKWGADLVGYLEQKIPEIISSIATWFSELPGRIYAAISGTVSKVAAWGSEVLAAFNEKVHETISNVVIWFSELPGKIYDTIIKIKEKIVEWGKNTVSFFQTEVPKIVDKVIEFFGELPKKIITVGENLVKGLWEGIFNLTNWLGTKIGDFCRGVIDGFKAGFDEHSPSKKAFQIGDYFTVGLMNGIVNKFGMVQSKVDDFVNGLTSNTIPIPMIDTSVRINRDIFNQVDTRTSMAFDIGHSNFKADISAELKAALSDIIDYDKLGDVLVAKLERANITAELDSNKAYNNTKEKWRQEVKRTGRSPVPIV